MKYLLISCLTLFANSIVAQQKTSLTARYALSISPLHLADIDNTVLIGGEYKFSPYFSLVLDAGYVFNSSYLNDIKSTKGYHLRPAMRFYNKKRGYIQGQAMVKSVTYTLYDWLGKDCVNEVPAYEQLQKFDYRKKVIAGNIMVGKLFRLFGDKGFIDIYAGLGLRGKNHEVLKERNACYLTNRADLFNIRNDHVILIGLPIGAKITYTLD